MEFVRCRTLGKPWEKHRIDERRKIKMKGECKHKVKNITGTCFLNSGIICTEETTQDCPDYEESES